MSSNRFTVPVWSAFRVVVGFLFACHGAASVLGLMGGAMGSGEPLEVGYWPNWWAGLIQLVCGPLVMLGLGTRVAALLASGSMAYAYFVVHQSEGLVPFQNDGVTPTLYAWSFLLVAALGAGPWSIDALVARRRGESTAEDRPASEPVQA